MRNPALPTRRPSKRALTCAGAAVGLVLLVTVLPAQKREYLEGHVYATSQKPLQLLADLGMRAFEPLDQPDENYPTIMIDPGKTFQTIDGFGGAFTDATADVFAQLPAGAQEKFLKELFDPGEGNGYTLCRTTIHSSDYSAGMYTYDEVAGDKELKHFSIDPDRKNRLPLIKRAQAAAKGTLQLYASPWSPPAWMKTNNDMLHGGKLKPEYRQAWADYFVKYIKAYAAEGLPIWAITVQNETMATQVWESCIFTATEEKDFVRDYLGPALHKNGLADVKVTIWDHNRGIMYQRAQVAYDDPEASKYIWGMAFHWYVGDHFENARMVHDAFPDKHLIFTEGSTRGTWQSAARLARHVITDLNNWTSAWTIWNMLLDEQGGPRHAGGLMGGTGVNANLKTGELTFNPPHYVFGQVSRFIRPGARRIACTSNSDDFVATAAVNPDGRIAVVLHNTSDHEQLSQVWVAGKALKLTCPAFGVMTVTIP
jgi:glucosylceramidase